MRRRAAQIADTDADANDTDADADADADGNAGGNARQRTCSSPVDARAHSPAAA